MINCCGRLFENGESDWPRSNQTLTVFGIRFARLCCGLGNNSVANIAQKHYNTLKKRIFKPGIFKRFLIGKWWIVFLFNVWNDVKSIMFVASTSSQNHEFYLNLKEPLFRSRSQNPKIAVNLWKTYSHMKRAHLPHPVSVWLKKTPFDTKVRFLFIYLFMTQDFSMKIKYMDVFYNSNGTTDLKTIHCCCRTSNWYCDSIIERSIWTMRFRWYIRRSIPSVKY